MTTPTSQCGLEITLTKQKRWRSPGMRRVRLIVWKLFRQTPLDQEIDGKVEHRVAATCKLPWSEYEALKAEHANLWLRWAAKRESARVYGWPRQPEQLRRWRRQGAPRRSSELQRAFSNVPGSRGLNKDVKLLVWAFNQLGY